MRVWRSLDYLQGFLFLEIATVATLPRNDNEIRRYPVFKYIPEENTIILNSPFTRPLDKSEFEGRVKTLPYEKMFRRRNDKLEFGEAMTILQDKLQFLVGK